MALLYPDILENNNPNFPLVNATSLKGTAYPLASINNTGSIPSDKRNVGTIVFDSGSGKFYGFKGSSVSTWNTPSNWIEFGSGTGGSTDLTPLNNFTASASTRLDSLEAATGSYVTNAKTGSFLYSGSYDSTTSALTLYSKATNYTLDLSGLAGGGGGGFAITASNEGTVLTENARTFDFVGNAVTATNIGSAVTVTVNTGSGATTNTGSLMITGSVNSNVLTFTKGDGSTFNLTVNTGSASVGTTNTGSLLVTGSVSNATITFTKGDGSTFPLTINNVNNAVSASFATTASYVLNAVSASFAPNIYNSDGTLTGNRTVDLNGESLTFIANEGESFRISSSISSDVTITGLPQASQSMVIGYNFSNGQLTAMNTSSFGGGTVNTGSLLVTGSVSNATLTFTKGNGSTFPLTVNNVANATTAGSVNSYSVYAEAGTDFNIWTDAGSTFTLLNVNGANIQAVAPKTTEASSRILAIATMEVFRSSSAANHTAFQYRMYNSTQAVAVAGSTREFSSYLSSGAEGTFATTFTFTVPISSDVTSGDTIELQVRKNPSAPLGTYSSASISYADLALVNITE